jgi:FMN phosphatase YigB (HAD superfamily)
MLDLPLIRALCFDMDGTLSDTDDHIVQRLASVLDALPLVSGRRAERLARQAVMAAETPVHAAYAKLHELGLGVPLFRLRERLQTIRARGNGPARTRNAEAIDEVPHEMVAGVREMIVTLARHYPMCTISTGGAPHVERFLEHCGVREYFSKVIGAQTTRRMKPHPESLLFAAAAMRCSSRGNA